MAYPVSWHWDFGDGESSTTPNPIHIYAMAGEYYVTETITDNDGNVLTATGIVYVYDFDYRGGRPNCSLTTKCYRLPVGSRQGFGVSEYMDNENPGLDWIWPPANIQIGKGYDILKREIALVLDSKTQREYQINDEEIWLDRVGSYGGGNIVKCEIHQKAHFSSEGEHVPIRHIEHHEVFKSYDRRRFQSTVGYDDVGMPLGLQVDNQLYQDGEPFTPVVETKKIPIDGDLVFQERVEARNLQLKTIVRGTPFWLTGILAYYETVDKSGAPSLRVMTEDSYQSDVSSMPVFHVSRNYVPLLNLATGVEATGTYSMLTTGPDNRRYSAIKFGVADSGISDALVSSLSGDFTFYVWIKNFPQTILPIKIFSTPACQIELVNSGYIALSILDPHGGIQIDLGITGHYWTMIAFVRSGLTVKVYKDKSLLTSYTIPAASDYGSSVTIGDANVEIFDPCIVPRAINSDGLAYYFDDIVRGGEQVLQPF